jgi:2-desacetyl-2-hydroxyethyl bacteriochlorophyllide A dehydrogenase
MAEYVSVPIENVIPIPDNIPDERAVFIEPLAAALEILEQLTILPNHTVLLIGDGKLALLIAHVLASTGCRGTMVGKHPDKLAKAIPLGLKTQTLDQFTDGAYDVVIEAAGKPSAFDTAVRNVKPRGTIVLKSTYADRLTIDVAPIVVNEITLIGSRCGRFSEAIRFLEEHKPALEELISDRFPLSRAREAFARSAEKDCLKVVLTVDS